MRNVLFTMFGRQSKLIRYEDNQEKVTHDQEKNGQEQQRPRMVRKDRIRR